MNTVIKPKMWRLELNRKFDDPTVVNPGVHIRIWIFIIGLDLYFRHYRAVCNSSSRNEKVSGWLLYRIWPSYPGQTIKCIGKLKTEDMGEFSFHAYQDQQRKNT